MAAAAAAVAVAVVRVHSVAVVVFAAAAAMLPADPLGNLYIRSANPASTYTLYNDPQTLSLPHEL